MQMLTIENLSKSKDRTYLLKDVTLGVQAGEILGLLGPCGAGKTTLMNIVSGLSMPDSGNVYIGGVNLHRDFEKCMRLTGVVTDNPAFFRNMSGFKNLKALAAQRGKISRERINGVIDALDLSYVADSKVSTYSKGELKRLAIAAAIMHTPRLLLLDEAIDGLDPVEFLNVRKLLFSMCRDFGTAVVMTSHQMREIEKTCKRVAVLEEGILIGVSTVERLRKFGTGKVCQRMLVDRPADAARHIFEAMDVRCEVRNGYVVFDCEQALVPKITAMLFNAGYMVYEARPHEISLEEAYYRLLRERPSVADDSEMREYGYEGGGY